MSPVVLRALFVAAAASGQGSPLAPSAELDDPALGWVDRIVQMEALDRGVPGMAVVVVHGERILLQRGYGIADIDTNRPVTAATPFNIASVTKPFTAAVVARLVERGILDLDAPVSTHLAWLPEPFRALTARQLLTHTSGIVRDVRRDNFDDPDAEEYRRRIATSQPSAAPGARWEYSNTGFTVLGWAAEEAAGASLAELMQREVFGPAGMLQAAFREPLEGDPERARPHEVVDGRARGTRSLSGGFGSGGASMSAADLAAFAVALQAGTVPLHADAWSPATLADGTTVHAGVYSAEDAYGFGWFLSELRGLRRLSHGGGIAGFSATLEHFPDRALTIAVLANAKVRDDSQAPVVRVAEFLLEALLENGRLERLAASTQTAAARELTRFTTAFSEAFMRADAGAIRSAYEPDALLLTEGGLARQGVDAAVDLFAPARGREACVYRLYSERLLLVGDIAVDQGTWFLVRDSDPCGSSGRYLLTLRRSGDGWRAIGDAWWSFPRP